MEMNYSNTPAMNISANDCNHDEPESSLVKIVQIIVETLVGVFGIAANIFVIVLAKKYTVRRNLHHLIINMAVSDTLFILMRTLTLITSNYRLSSLGILGDILCKTIFFLNHVSYSVSLATLLIISIERFRATRTMRISRPYTLKQRVAVLSSCWLIPMTFQAYMLYSAKAYDGNCMPYGWNLYTQYMIRLSTMDLLFIIIFGVIFSLSILTIRRLSRPQAINAHLSEEQRNIRASRTQAAVRMVVVSLLLYMACWIPGFVYVVLITTELIVKDIVIVDPCIDEDLISFIIFGVPNLVNSSFSPCIYIVFLSDFREAAKKVLCRTTTNQRPNRRNSIELQPNPNPVDEPRMRRRRNSDEDHDI